MEQNENSPSPPSPAPQQPMSPQSPAYHAGGNMPPTWQGTLNQGDDWQRQTDLHHLKLLSIFYYISAGLQVLGGCLGLIYFIVGLGVALAPPPDTSDAQNTEEAQQVVGGVFMLLGGCIGLLCIVLVVLAIMTGISLNTQRRRTLCLITAAITCLNIPLGTVLGIFTFVVLSRASVVALFDQKRMPMA